MSRAAHFTLSHPRLFNDILTAFKLRCPITKHAADESRSAQVNFLLLPVHNQTIAATLAQEKLDAFNWSKETFSYGNMLSR
jgi:hypothetical protein